MVESKHCAPLGRKTGGQRVVHDCILATARGKDDGGLVGFGVEWQAFEDVPCCEAFEGVVGVFQYVVPKSGGDGVEIGCCVVSSDGYLCYWVVERSE